MFKYRGRENMTVRCSNTELQKTWKFGSSNTFNQET